MATRVITPIGVVSYPHLDKPQPGKKGRPPKYSMVLIFDTEAQKDPRFAEMKAAAIEAWETKFGKTIALPSGKEIGVQQAFDLKVLRSPFRDDGITKGYPEGSIYITARTEDQPTCIRGDKSKIAQEDIRDTLYPGSKARASVAASAYDEDGNRGVSFYLNNVQKAGDGPRIDNRKSAEEEFDSLDVAPEDVEALLG